MGYVKRIGGWVREHPISTGVLAFTTIPLGATVYSAIKLITTHQVEYLIPLMVNVIAITAVSSASIYLPRLDSFLRKGKEGDLYETGGRLERVLEEEKTKQESAIKETLEEIRAHGEETRRPIGET